MKGDEGSNSETVDLGIAERLPERATFECEWKRCKDRCTYPSTAQAKWARLESSANLGPWRNPDPYFVSLDLATARHAQTLLATHLNGKPLTVEHGAPLRQVSPVKLGLKNIKAITRISYTKDEPVDYWAMHGYSRYDGI